MSRPPVIVRPLPRPGPVSPTIFSGGASAEGPSNFNRPDARSPRPDMLEEPGQRHRFAQRAAQNYPYLANEARRDARGFGQGYRPDVLGDERAINEMQQRAARGVVPFEDVIARLDNPNLPPGVKQGSFLAQINAFGTDGAVRLIPMNPFRKGLLISNFIGANLILFSFGQPINTGTGIGAGVPLTPCYQETNGTISIDDIWVFCNDSTVDFPLYVLGYEANPSVAGSKW